jgi:hypothetical protein
MPIGVGATYVCDFGYYDFGFWAGLDELGWRLVTRFKTNTPLISPHSLPLQPGSPPLPPTLDHAGREMPASSATQLIMWTAPGAAFRLGGWRSTSTGIAKRAPHHAPDRPHWIGYC